VRYKLWVQPQRPHYLLRTEERRAHPAGVKAEVVGGEQSVLGRRPQGLDCHRRLAALALRVRVGIQVFEVQA
jgi:hypothetical protein